MSERPGARDLAPRSHRLGALGPPEIRSGRVRSAAMAPAETERRTAGEGTSQPKRGRKRTRSPTRPRLIYIPGPAAAAPGPQPHRGAASGAACVISARPSAHGTQGTRLHFRLPPGGETSGRGSVGSAMAHAQYGSRDVSLVAPAVCPLIKSSVFVSLLQCDLASALQHFLLLSLHYGGEGREEICKAPGSWLPRPERRSPGQSARLKLQSWRETRGRLTHPPNPPPPFLVPSGHGNRGGKDV
ncbi:hypothetical protein J0S82_012476 [Galemys pyrenaicus]|uniref:Uncharacterized protein n=1 Tax=Galemys pyrenaicus TaxID=202257 RepID=A0A8J6AIA4_GALPY|nr:hypothetical protein J0S82_012476 [Galemys pyrenaicus]